MEKQTIGFQRGKDKPNLASLINKLDNVHPSVWHHSFYPDKIECYFAHLVRDNNGTQVVSSDYFEKTDYNKYQELAEIKIIHDPHRKQEKRCYVVVVRVINPNTHLINYNYKFSSPEITDFYKIFKQKIDNFNKSQRKIWQLNRIDNDAADVLKYFNQEIK